jgi:SAM-dependent methyltransferase
MSVKPDPKEGEYQPASREMSRRSAETHAEFMIAQLKPGMRLLDVGCGTGSITVGFAGYVNPGDVVGIDTGEAEIKAAVENAENLALSNVKFQVGGLTNLPFVENEFDAVFAGSAIEFIPDAAAAIDQIARVLRPGGVVGLSGGTPSRHIAIPDEPFIKRYRAIHRAVRVSRGEHPEMGIEQIALLRNAGFVELDITGTFETRPANADHADVFAGDQFVKEAEGIGASTRDEIEKLASEIRAYAEIPNALGLVPSIRVVAKLPE